MGSVGVGWRADCSFSAVVSLAGDDLTERGFSLFWAGGVSFTTECDWTDCMFFLLQISECNGFAVTINSRKGQQCPLLGLNFFCNFSEWFLVTVERPFAILL
jgi:hypothetical protein